MDRDIDNPDNYKFGILYFNPKDKRIIVPKIDRYRGWTLNFGNKYAYLLAFLIVLVFVSLALFSNY